MAAEFVVWRLDAERAFHVGQFARLSADILGGAGRPPERARRAGRPRTEIPRADWRFARLEGDRLVPIPAHVFHAAGFEPGLIYEVVYPAQDPRIVGLGLAAIRDAISFFRFERADRPGRPTLWPKPARPLPKRR